VPILSGLFEGGLHTKFYGTHPQINPGGGSIVVVFATQIPACSTKSPESLLENRQYSTPEGGKLS